MGKSCLLPLWLSLTLSVSFALMKSYSSKSGSAPVWKNFHQFKLALSWMFIKFYWIYSIKYNTWNAHVAPWCYKWIGIRLDGWVLISILFSSKIKIGRCPDGVKYRALSGAENEYMNNFQKKASSVGLIWLDFLGKKCWSREEENWCTTPAGRPERARPAQ